MRSGRLIWFIGKRFLFVIPQLIGVTIVAFFIIRILPGDPVYLLLGQGISPESVEALTQRMGLDQPVYVQYGLFIRNIFRGDLGYSWYTSNPVVVDLVRRLPATLELITYSMLVIVVVMIPLARLTALKGNRIANRIVRGYGLMAGAFPDFWLALILIFVFYVQFRWFPAPIGRLDPAILPPVRITGFYTIDGLLTGRFDVFVSALYHLALPVLSMAIYHGGPILKMSQSTMLRVKNEEYVKFLKDNGINRRTLDSYVFKNSLPPVVTLIGFIYVLMLGGSVLIETIFGWGGIGQYAVQAIAHSDYAPLQAFVLIVAFISLIVYLILDIVYVMIDPRIEL